MIEKIYAKWNNNLILIEAEDDEEYSEEGDFTGASYDEDWGGR